MSSETKNPFDLVKATDLSDEQIANYFVDFPQGASLRERINPTSRMSMIILGGKGSGKTHLMRYLTYSLQARRNGVGASGRAGILKEGWLGIYFLLSALNAQRFSGKGQTDDTWMAVFGYYMEIWLGQLVLRVVQDLYSDLPPETFASAVADAAQLLDVVPTENLVTLADFARTLEALQRKADIAINNSAVSRRLDIQIQATPGRIVFGLPQVLRRHFPELSGLVFLYLLDEFENLTQWQQRYVNSLLRERQEPCSFRVGVRLYGMRTNETLNAGEHNREGSEYEALRLDEEMRARPEEAQDLFAQKLVRKRLQQAGYVAGDDTSNIAKWFEEEERSQKAAGNGTIASGTAGAKEPPYFAALRQKLDKGTKAGTAPGIRTKAAIDQVVASLAFPEDPLVERTSLFLFYRAWASRKELIGAAQKIAESAAIYTAGGTGPHSKVLKYFRADISANLLREIKQKQRYVGFSTFVRMSAGLPRGLLTILKHVFTWSLFFSEEPFVRGQVSIRAQIEGVRQASEWFYTEARSPGPLGTAVRDAMTRLGELLRDLRFSDKPAECSLSTISADTTAATENARKVLDEAVNWSMLVHVRGGQHDRNRGRVDEKYQIHPMLAPRWDLPISRRGALALSGAEVSAIFDNDRSQEFDGVRRRRMGRMTAPFGLRMREASSTQDLLPGIEHE